MIGVADHRRSPASSSRTTTSRSSYVFRTDDQQLRLLRPRAGVTASSGSCSRSARSGWRSTPTPATTPRPTWRGDAQGLARGGGRHGHGRSSSRRSPASSCSSRSPSRSRHPGAVVAGGVTSSRYIWQTSMGSTLGRVPALHHRRARSSSASIAVASHRRSRMMFAFSRDGAVPGHQAWRKVSRHRVPVERGRSRSASLGFLLAVPDVLEQRRVGYCVGTSIGNDRALHRLHPAGHPAAAGRRRASSRARGASGEHYRSINWIAILWVAFISVLFMMPTVARRDSVASSASTWNVVNYAPITDRRQRSCSSAAGGCSRRKKWFKGPVAHGNRRRSSERLEAKQEGSFAASAPTRSSPRQFGSEGPARAGSLHGRRH